MSGGISGYGRTDAGESDDDPIALLFDALTSLREWQNITSNANIALSALRRISDAGTIPHIQMINYSVELRDLTYRAWLNNELPWFTPLYWDFMQICSVHWKTMNPPMSTGIRNTVLDATETYHNTQNRFEKIGAAEQLGICSTQYEMSAFLGIDITQEYLQNTEQLGTSKYVVVHDDNRQLVYFEGGGSYNINVMLKTYIGDIRTPIVLVSEGKGNSSAIGQVRGPKTMLRPRGISRVRQDNYMYPITRAHYMSASSGSNEIAVARRNSGREILAAHERGRMIYIVSNGKISGSDFTSRLLYHGHRFSRGR